MAQWIRSRNAVHMHLQDLSSRVVAESGIATDRYHLGKLILQGFKDAPDFLLQIDGATGETEIFESALKRSIQCATAFRKLGIKKGDVVVLMAPHHIHQCIPMYAALYVGAVTAGLDMTLKIYDLKVAFNINKPSIIFCQSERAADVNLALKDLNFESKIVTFDEGDSYLTFTDLLNKYGSGISVEDFKATDIDPTETIALLLSTSGTTGMPKSAAVTHLNFAISAPNIWVLFDKSPTPTRLTCILTPIQWYSAYLQYIFSPIMRNSRLQSSLPMTQEHAYCIINKYKPTFTIASPSMWATLFKVGDRENCDFSSFEIMFAAGSALQPTLLDVISEILPNTCFASSYGLSELSGPVFVYDSTHPKSVGRPALIHDFRLVSPDTQRDVTESHVLGELWIKGPAVFKVSGIYFRFKVSFASTYQGPLLDTGLPHFVDDLKVAFNINKPSIIFCQSERAADVNLALKDLNFESKIVTFDEGDSYLTFTDLLNKYGSGISVEDFKATDIDPTETIALLLSTSGTTGMPKSAAVTHLNFAISAPNIWVLFDKSPTPTRLTCILTPIQWYSAYLQYIFSPIMRNSRLQSSLPMTQEHAYCIINKYKPTFTIASPSMWATLFKVGDRENCDFSSFEIMFAAGSALQPTLLDVISEILPNTCFASSYGLSELSGPVFVYDSTHPKSVGRPALIHDFRLVSPDTQRDVTEPHVLGELWIKGPAVFKGYYNDPEGTASAFSADGWFKTGDLFKRDEQWYFYFVERMKMLLKYQTHQISPVELENVIGNHPAVFEVAVTGMPHPEHGDLPVACIVPYKNATVTAQEIKDLVKESLADSKQLRGGVIFLKSLPMTPSSKVNRPLLATLALSSERL